MAFTPLNSDLAVAFYCAFRCQKKTNEREKDILDLASMRPLWNWLQYIAIRLPESWIIWIAWRMGYRVDCFFGAWRQKKRISNETSETRISTATS